MTAPIKPTGNRGAGYIRVSHGDTEANEFRRNQDPAAQRVMIEQWAARHGKTISRWYMDVEGRNPRDMAHKREQFQQLLKDVQAGLWDWVVVDSQDRIGDRFRNLVGRCRRPSGGGGVTGKFGRPPGQKSDGG